MDIAQQALEAACQRRRYIHFDTPLSRTACQRLVTDPVAVTRHAFYPFLSFVLERKRFKRLPGNQLRKSIKQREIRYAAHADSAIYSYYNALLSQHYEAELKRRDLASCVTAFRSLGRSNVHFAHEVFEWIEKHRPCVAVGLDIKGFFDNLDHERLKRAWASLLGDSRLPDDHYAVYRSLTKHASVDLHRALESLGLSKHNMRRGGAKRLCTIDAFRTRVKGLGLVQVNDTSKGIPQGSPLSATLSNLYMLPFDEKVQSEIVAKGGLYRRYCDDILIIVPPTAEKHMLPILEREISILSLEIQAEKNVISCFPETGLANRPLPYLGLVYDGRSTRLRPSGVARYYAKMRAGIKQLRKAKLTEDGRSLLESRKGLLYKRYTAYSGREHRNYVKYAEQAARITASPAIRRQLRRHMRKFKLWTGL